MATSPFHDYQNKDVHNIVRQRDARIAVLEAENAALRVAAETRQQDERLVRKYNELHKRYRDLERKQAEYVTYIKTARAKYLEAKEATRQWQAWVDSHRERLHDDHFREPDSEDADETTNESRELPARASSNTCVTEKTHSPMSSDHGVERVTSSQTTEGEPEPSLSIKNEQTSDDVPQVVSTRSLKRQRSDSTQAQPARRIKQEPTSPSDPIELHSEDYSSPVLTRHRLVRAETSDLDALVQHSGTPHRHIRRRGVSEEALKPIALLAATSSLSEGAAPEVSENMVRVDSRNRRLGLAATAKDFVVQPTGIYSALQPISANVSTMARTTIHWPDMKRKRRNDDIRAKVLLVAEDGEDEPSLNAAIKRENTSKTHASRRLDSLLEEPSPDRPPLPKRRTPESTTLHRRGHAKPPIERQKVAVKKSPPGPTTTLKLQRGLEHSPPSAQPEHKPLRSRPVRGLNLEDFKINPKYMGSDYAFADTFRGREKRRCLQGCMKPNCCGDAFRKAVELGGNLTTKPDAQVLEEYLGSSWRALLRAYSPGKQKDLVLQAHAHAFAQEHGKHRHAFERRSTPPGFWRTDMPTTQEEEEDRARAHELEREKVEERWREAMREGGRWVFRDE